MILRPLGIIKVNVVQKIYIVFTRKSVSWNFLYDGSAVEFCIYLFLINIKHSKYVNIILRVHVKTNMYDIYFLTYKIVVHMCNCVCVSMCVSFQ